jgi:hypothetical protein
MTVLTRPDDTAPTIAAPPDAPEKPAMTVRLANCLVTSAPMTTAELKCCHEHYYALLLMFDISGPIFSSMRRQAVEMHNRAVRRLNGVREEAKRRAEDDERILEIER